MAAKPRVIFTEAAPKPLPQFSQAVVHNGVVYCSGNIGLDPKTSKLVEGGVKAQTEQALQNLTEVLKAAGSSLKNVVKLNIYITTMDNFSSMNEGYDKFFKDDYRPGRTCVAVYQLPLNASVEIECTAFVENNARL